MAYSMRERRVGAARALRMLVVALALFGASLGSPRAAEPPATVQQPRAFGYVIGDVLTQRVLLAIDGRTLEPSELPAAGRISVWFDRRSARIEKDYDGRRWLAVEYQLINAPQTLVTARLPAWTLKTRARGPAVTIPAWAITVAPLTPRTAEPDAALLQPDRPSPVISTTPILRRIVGWSSALIAVLAGWLAWVLWRNHRASANQPFAQAWREIRHADEAAAQAWQALHRAFDRTAGRVVQTESLSELFRRAPHFVPLESRIEQFFAQSGERFFGAGVLSAPISVRALCADLRRLEKRYER